MLLKLLNHPAWIAILLWMLPVAAAPLLADKPDTTALAQAGEATNDSNPYHYDEDYYRNESIDWGKLFDFFLYSQDKLVNHTMVSVGAGFSFPTIPNNVFAGGLPNTNYLNLEYGFVRLDSNYSLRQLRNYSSEFAFMEDNTNQYGLIKASDNSIYTNIFSFGFGLSSGFGMELFPNELYGLHSTAFNWSYIDYSAYPDNKHFTTFDNQWKFGNKGAATVEYRLGKNCLLDLQYEHINIYSGMDYWKWLGSLGIDFVLQRWIDVLDPIFINEFGYAYPFIKFFYKNAISIIFSELRQANQFYPFVSEYSLLERRLSLQLKFLF